MPPDAPEQAVELEPLAIDVLDMAPIGPFEKDDDKPKPKARLKQPKVEEHLRQLEFARKEDKPQKKRYRQIVETLDKEQLTVDEANSLGCAWAWLAYLERELGYWERAIEALRKAIDGAKSSKDRNRSETNLKHVVDAWNAMAKSK